MFPEETQKCLDENELATEEFKAAVYQHKNFLSQLSRQNTSSPRVDQLPVENGVEENGYHEYEYSDQLNPQPQWGNIQQAPGSPAVPPRNGNGHYYPRKQHIYEKIR